MKNLTLFVSVVIAFGALFLTPNAHATASFSRQTGMSCTACHTTFPELTAFGRDFKLNGYTLTAAKEITDKGDKKNSPLSLLEALPLSINLKSAYTATGNRQPGTRNNNVEFPQQVNLWYAGKITDHIGSYTQMSYNNVGKDHFTFDNSDFFRYSRQTKLAGKNLVWGIDGNNNPTFEDLWSSTPAYGFPWAAPDAAISPNAATLIDGGLAGDVVGLGGYGMLDNHLYGNVTLYRTQHIGGPQPANGSGFAHNIKGAAPYWRFAWQASKGKNYLEVGTYGLFAKSFPGNVGAASAISGPTDSFTDAAADVSYERNVGKSDLFVVHSTFIYEKQSLDATAVALALPRVAHDLRTFRLDADYHFGTKYTVLAGPFITTGTADTTLYAPGAVTGSANGKPNNKGVVGQLAYWPMQNIELGIQYRAYTTFNGGGKNYDGSGRNASANNTAYAFIWFSF